MRTNDWMKRLAAGTLAVLAVGAAAQVPADPQNYSRTRNYTYKDNDLYLNGQLETETIEPANPSLCSVVRYEYDYFLNRTGTRVSPCANAAGMAKFTERYASITTKAVTGQEITVNGSKVIVNIPAGVYAGSATNPEGKTESTTYDPRFGVPLTATDVNKQVVTQTVDDFGRVVRQKRPDGTSVVTLYCMLPNTGLDASSNSAGCAGQSFSSEAPADAVAVQHREPHDTADAKMGAYTRTFVDRLGRTLRASTEAFNGPSQPAGPGRVVVVDTRYNEYGAVVMTSRAYFLATGSSSTAGSGNAAGTRIDPDVLGRAKAIYVADADGSQDGIDFAGLGRRRAAVTRFERNGQSVTITNDKGKTRREERDVRGLLVRATDHDGAQIARKYDAWGNLILTTDALQNKVGVQFDILGRKRALLDPDLGIWGYCVDPLGQVRATQNSKMRGEHSLKECPTSFASDNTAPNVLGWTTWAYDKLSRPTKRIETEYVTNWVYDSCTNGVGQLCSSNTDHGMDRKFVYDTKGRLQSERVTTYGLTWGNQYDYDAITGRLASRVYPTGLKLKYGYSASGHLSSVKLVTTAKVAGATLNTALWTADKLDAAGRPEAQTIGNLAGTSVSVRQPRDPLGRMASINAGIDTQTKILSQSYTWDSLGRLAWRSDANGNDGVNAVTESFGYDNANRLHEYTVAGKAVPNMARTVTMEYNAIGNLLSKSDVGVYDYYYGTDCKVNGSAGVRPHAVSLAAGTTYCYDYNGNVESATGGKYRGIDYTSFNLPSGGGGSSSSGGIVGPNSTPRSLWLYDENHQRVQEIHIVGGSTRKTWYGHPDNSGGLGFEHELAADGSRSNRHYVTAGGQTIVLVSSGELPVLGIADAPTALGTINLTKAEVWYGDALGSVASSADQNGQVTVRYAYDPFGKRRHADGRYDASGNLVYDWNSSAAGADRGFTGHEHLDDLGLIHMNGRLYDPQIGRFVQADPAVTAPGNLQSYNRYSYCRSNPLNCTDPSGMSDLMGDGALGGISIGWSPPDSVLSGSQNWGFTAVPTNTNIIWRYSNGDYHGEPAYVARLTLQLPFSGGLDLSKPTPQSTQWASAVNAAKGGQSISLATTGSASVGGQGKSFDDGGSLGRASKVLQQWRQVAPNVEPAGGFPTPNELVESWAEETLRKGVEDGSVSPVFALAMMGGLWTGRRPGDTDDSKGKTIGLGLDSDLPRLYGSGAITYRNGGWQKSGLTTVDWARAAMDNFWFKKSFNEATRNADAIRFDVSNFNPGYPRPGLTNWEFDQIINNSQLSGKTTFVQHGQEVIWNGTGFVQP